MPRIYDFKDFPRRSRLRISAEMAPYVEAWRAGQAIGDGIPYQTDRDARRVATKYWARGKSILDPDTDPLLSQRVWNDGGKYYWALIPKPNLTEAEQMDAVLNEMFGDLDAPEG